MADIHSLMRIALTLSEKAQLAADEDDKLFFGQAAKIVQEAVQEIRELRLRRRK